MTDPTSPVHPAPPQLRYSFTVALTFRDRLETGAMVSGSKRGQLTITGGTVSGPDLSGVVLPGGGDAPTVRPDGVALLDARYLFRTDDGFHITVVNRGIRRASADVVRRLTENEDAVAPSEYYLRTSPVFDVEPGPYSWLSDYVFVGVGRRVNGGNVIDYFRVE